ncbi:MAG TPA: VacJ family lipoprotein [Rhodanobacteraceae bacterium]|nr:VacJ family lipoprotein [Rhodanobacteraceae bacterium]
MRPIHAFGLRRAVLLVALLALAGCATVPPPRTDDPLQNFNRKMYSFNRTADRVAIRPVATAYRKVTTPGAREHINDFFSNVRLPITIVNELLQAHPVDALKSTGRLAVNTTLGLLGFFDPASRMNLPLDETDFGVTLAHWGVPEGPFVVIPLVGPTTARDIWRLPVDSYFDPLSWYSREHDLKLHAQYLPSLAYLITLRSRGLDAENFLNSAYDPYIFERDAYRQKRIYEIYHGDPPASVIERFQGVSDNGDDIDQLLEEQHAYEKSQGQGSNTEPAGGSSSGPPPDSNSPASASST